MRSGPGHRRLPQRHLRQRAGDHHRPVRPPRGAPGGRQGLAGRLDPRQHPARHGRRDVRRRPQARAPEVRPHGGERAVADAAAGGHRAGDAGDLPARRGRRAAEADGEGAQLRRRHRAPLDRRVDRPAHHLLRGAALLAQDAQGPLQPRARGRRARGRAVVGPQVGADARRRRHRRRRDVGDPRRLDHRGVGVDRAVAVLRRHHRRRDRRQRRRALGGDLLRGARQDGPVGQHRDRLERPDRAVRRAGAGARLAVPRAVPDVAGVQRARAGRDLPRDPDRPSGDPRG